MVGSVENTRIMIIIGAVAVKIDLARKKGIIISVRVVLVFVTKTRIISDYFAEIQKRPKKKAKIPLRL